MKPPLLLLDLLYEAMTKDVGLIVSTTNPIHLRNRFYLEQKKDPVLKPLAFVLSPINPGSELWIIRKGDPDAQG